MSLLVLFLMDQVPTSDRKSVAEYSQKAVIASQISGSALPKARTV